jgi:hypothetical protein
VSFDSKAFMKTKFLFREESVKVPDLKDFFPVGEEPLWKVRGLEGVELGRVREANKRNSRVAAAVSGLLAGNEQETIDGIKQLFGLTGDVPEDTAIRMDMLCVASIDPKVEMDLAVKLCACFPIEFSLLTDRIMLLTGQGKVPGERRGSGKTKVSEPVSTSAT